MQSQELNLINVLKHAARWHSSVEIVTSSVEGNIHRINYGELYLRTQQLANALQRIGISQGDRVGTMAWNTWRHLECWYAIGGMGAICHTLNPRLFADQIDYIINHAEDRLLIIDSTFVPIIAAVKDRLTTIEAIIVLTDDEHMPDCSQFDIPVYSYESLIADQSSQFDWPDFDENTASSLCYTSGTTGNPKGVLYSHRSNIIHALVGSSADLFGLTSKERVLMVVPMFHANSWGLSFAAPMAGCKMVLPGAAMDGASIYNLMTAEKCTMSAAVPTVWTGLLNYLDQNQLQIPDLKETFIGGSAVPRSMIERFDNDYGVKVIHAWGMTETSPLGTLNRPLPFMSELSDQEQMDIRCKQGRPCFGIDIKIIGEEGDDLPHDGVTFGRLMVKGPWVVERYFRAEQSAIDEQGWFDTGDVATIDQHGIMQITDRAKDVIKSGGEWISSVDVENCAMGHEQLEIAACIAAKHEKWEERPLLIAVKKVGCEPTKESILALIAGVYAKWQVPDDVIFIDEMPLTATGKIDKKPLRAKFENYYL